MSLLDLGEALIPRNKKKGATVGLLPAVLSEPRIYASVTCVMASRVPRRWNRASRHQARWGVLFG